MIRYRITKKALLKLIAVEDRRQKRRQSWLVRADKKLAAMKERKKFVNGGSIWGDIKQVYMDLQNYKCGFCERKLPQGLGANYEHDVEHFRPKQEVKAWVGEAFPRDTGAALKGGYYWLAYDPFNYVTTCRICNSAFKKNFFPIEGERGAAFTGIAALQKSEKPLLIYPLGAIDEDPERLLSFQGMAAVAVSKSGGRQRRALVAIQLFSLNLREDLLRQRSQVIEQLWEQIERRENGDSAARLQAVERIQRLISPRSMHTNCGNAFLRLYEEDPTAAYRYYEATKGLLREQSRL